MNQSDDYIILGKVSGIHGVKGWVKIHSFTSPRMGISEYNQWLFKSTDNWEPRNLVCVKKQGKGIIALLEGVADRNQAEALQSVDIAIHKDQLKTLSENEFYWKDLIGLSVETILGVKLGKIDWVFETGSNDVLVIKDTSGAKIKERMLPFVFRDVVKKVDLEKSLMIVDWDPEF